MIDYCTILFDERERVLFPLHINSLRHYMPGVFNIKVSVRPEDSEAIALCEKFGVEALPHPIYTQSPDKSIGNLCSFDHANRLDLLMKASTSDWVFLSHMDIIWIGTMMLYAQPLMTDKYGMLGHYPTGIIAVNRKAYGECHTGFWHYSFNAQYWDDGKHPPWVRLIGVGPQPGDNLAPVLVIPSVDVGCMLEIEMQSYAYRFDRSALMNYHHIGSGSYHGRGGEGDFDKDVPLNEATIATHKAIAENVREILDKFSHFNKGVM